MFCILILRIDDPSEQTQVPIGTDLANFGWSLQTWPTVLSSLRRKPRRSEFTIVFQRLRRISSTVPKWKRMQGPTPILLMLFTICIFWIFANDVLRIEKPLESLGCASLYSRWNFELKSSSSSLAFVHLFLCSLALHPFLCLFQSSFWCSLQQ